MFEVVWVGRRRGVKIYFLFSVVVPIISPHGSAKFALEGLRCPGTTPALRYVAGSSDS